MSFDFVLPKFSNDTFRHRIGSQGVSAYSFFDRAVKKDFLDAHVADAFGDRAHIIPVLITEIGIIDNDIESSKDRSLYDVIPHSKDEFLVIKAMDIVIQHGPEEVLVDPFVLAGKAPELLLGPGRFPRSLDTFC
jgi:hypothetical protein